MLGVFVSRKLSGQANSERTCRLKGTRSCSILAYVLVVFLPFACAGGVLPPLDLWGITRETSLSSSVRNRFHGAITVEDECLDIYYRHIPRPRNTPHTRSVGNHIRQPQPPYTLENANGDTTDGGGPAASRKGLSPVFRYRFVSTFRQRRTITANQVLNSTCTRIHAHDVQTEGYYRVIGL
ncbi:type 2 phosphatidic acid phosphatase beta [Anopheles sinensis]|uniref:Type 2 phosphatidic acid phosphatase beta n=1 Tax=Anopheles sinensis TaxID=74873 RepID=A0A084W4G8_ANOSI|nr:type 2 phosphatidic acid phosphatase beta [Anopheles sinensis]